MTITLLPRPRDRQGCKVCGHRTFTGRGGRRKCLNCGASGRRRSTKR